MTYHIEVYKNYKSSRKLAYSEKVKNGLDALFKLYDFVRKNDFEGGDCYIFEKIGDLVEIRYCDFHKLKKHINTSLKKTELGGGMVAFEMRPSPLETIVLSEEQLDNLKKI